MWASGDLVHIYTYRATAQNEKIDVENRVVVEYKDYFIQADRAVYLKNKQIVKLYGNILLIQSDKSIHLSNYALLDLLNDTVLATPYFSSEYASSVWMAGSAFESDKNVTKVKHSFISSCDTRCSDWKIGFNRGYYYKNRKWVNLYGVRLYLNDIPIIYLPYIGFSTQKKRQTGLLRPSFGISKNEGFTYIQPIYFAPQNWWDLEFDPQIRTKRGKGLYTTLRFVDAFDAYGIVRTGGFYEDSDYFAGQKLKNSKHYGTEIFYKREYIFNNAKTHDYDSLYAHLQFYNDIDYFNLQKNDDTLTSYDSLTVSRLNYVNFTDLYSYRIYFKYFKDNLKLDNDDTLQQLPSINIHRFETPVFNKYFTYMFDFNMNNYYRKKGLKAVEYQFSLPFSFRYKLFDDYLGVSISEKLFGNYAFYSGKDLQTGSRNENSYIFRNTHNIALFSDLVKEYDDFIHYLQLQASLNIPSYEKTGGNEADFINIEEQSKNLELSLRQFFFDGNGKQRLYHILTQPIYYDESDKVKDLENEFGINLFPNIDFNTDIFFSYKYHTVSSVVSTLSYDGERYTLYLSHYYKDCKDNNADSNYVHANITRRLSKKYKLFATIDYDLQRSFYNRWSFGFYINKKCWDLKIGFKKEHIPILTSSGINAYLSDTLFFRFNLYPLGGISKSFTQTTLQGTL